MKLFLSLATTLLLSLSVGATELQSLELNLTPGNAEIQGNQRYSYNFGTTPVRLPRYVDFTLNNRGPLDLLVQSIRIGGMDFDAYHNCPRSIPPGRFCTIRVTFNPWDEGFKTGWLLIRTNEGLIQIDLMGWGHQF